MAFWNTFTSAISALPTGFKSLTGGSNYLSPEEQQKEQDLHNLIQDGIASVSGALSHIPQHSNIKKVTKGAADILLQGAVKLNQDVLSPFVFRPLATAGLVTDLSSPLYKKGQYEAGFQFSDIQAAYNRSAKVSTMQALTKSDLTPIKGLSAAVLSTGKINLDNVNLWDDQNIQHNFVDNAVGRWFTGIGDFVVGNKALSVAGKIAKVGAVKPLATRIGLDTSKKTLDQLSTEMSDGILHANTNGVQGTQTISGSHMVALAESKDWGTVTDLVSKYSTNEKLIALIYDTTDANVVKDLIMADKGHLPALENLAKTSPDKLFNISDTASHLRSKYLQAGSSYLPEGPAVPRLKAAYEAAIANEPKFAKIRDAFFDSNYDLKVGGKAYMPKETTIGRGAAIKAQEFVRSQKETIRFREQYADVLETSVGFGEGLKIRFVKWTARQGEYKPLGFVTLSGMRPLDGHIELNAFLNDLKIFRDGNKKIVTGLDKSGKVIEEKAADVRRRWEEDYMRSLGKNETVALEKIDEEIGKIIAYQHGWFNDKEIADHINKYRTNINSGLTSVKQIGMGVGHDGSQIHVDPQTLRQLGESYAFTPWNRIEKQIEFGMEKSKGKALAMGATQTAQAVFRDLNRLWTFDVLVRPMYIIKQSIAEPIVSATLAQGIDFLKKDVGKIGLHGTLNSGRWMAEKIANIANKSERKAVNEAVLHNQQMLAKAEEIKNIAQAHFEELMSKKTSPGTRAQWTKAAKNELRAANRLLEEAELNLRAAVVPYGVKEAIPSVTTLERRLAFLKSRPMTKAEAAAVYKAERAIGNSRVMVQLLATKSSALKEAELAVENAYKEIDGIVSKLSESLQEQANVWGKNARFRKRYYAVADSHMRMVNGQYVPIDSFTTGPAPFSSAIRAETSNARTVDMNFLNDLSVATRKSLIERKSPSGLVRVSDPVYFGELEYIANRIMRGDPLMDLILAETPASELAVWSQSSAGRAYLRQFGVTDTKEYASFLKDRVAMVRRTFPTTESRAAVLNHEVSAAELQKMLSPNLNELYDIIPSNYNYGAASLGGGKYAALNNAVDNTSSRIFRWMASVENPIRNAFFDRVAVDEVARRADILIKQGVEMTPARYNALRQAAGREALQELEKTVYTVRRQNRLLHNARWAVAFPTANFNAFYRYGRLAAKNPVQAAGFANNYARAFMNFGVDENGNPTNDMSKITHLIVPGTKEMGLGPMGQGVALSSRSIGFLLNMPSPSFVTALSVGQLMQKFPGTEDGLKKALNIGGIDYFSVMFPYGAPTSLKDSFISPWAKSLWNAATGPQGKADYLASWNSVYNYHHMLYEMGIEKNFPSDKAIEIEVRRLWWDKFFAGFASPAGVPFKVESNPMRLSSNLYYKLIEKYVKDGNDYQKSRDLAGDEMMKLLGPKFMVDRVSFTGSNKNLNIPATYEAYKRVFEDNPELTKQLANIDSNDIKVVGLLTADLSRDPADRSNNIMTLLQDPNTTLPGTSKRLNELKLKPQEVEAERLKQRTWDQYMQVKEALTAQIKDGKTLRAHPELKGILDMAVEKIFKGQSQSWYDEYMLAQNGDTSYKYSRALTTIVSDKKFMAANGKSEFWQDAKTFMQSRAVFAGLYQSLPDYDSRKAVIRDQYNNWVELTMGQWHPAFANILSTYFSNDTLKAVN